jgi:glycogen synthase
VPLNTRTALPKRVFMTSDTVGGVWTYALELASYLSGNDIDVQICVLGPGPSWSQEEAARRAGVSSLDISNLRLDWTAVSESELDIAAAELQDRAQDGNADLVHLNAPAQAGMSDWRLPLTVSAHSCVGTWWAHAGKGAMPPDLAWRARRTGVGLTLADAVIAPSAAFARDLASIYGELIPIVAVHNGRTVPATVAPKKDDSIVFTAGRLWDAGKNLAVVGEAAKLARQTIYAAGPQRGPNGETADLPHLCLLGTLGEAEMNEWYRRAGIFVSMSKYEPFGLAVLEAAQAGAALVLSDIPTFRELWEGAAIFTDPEDPKQLASTIIRLMASPHERSTLAAAAAARSLAYSSSRMGAQTLDVYASALGARAPSFVQQETGA